MAYEDMVDILEEYKKYLPCKNIILTEPIPDTDITQDKEYVCTLLGGDYLSVARARGAQHIRRTSELEMHRLDGMLPVTEDWHAKVCLLEVFWRRLFKTTSGTQRGTLYQLRNLINRRNVTKKPKSDVNAAEDFVEVVTISHVLTAVMTYLGMSSLTDVPSHSSVPQEIWMEDDDCRKKILEDIATHIISEHVDLATAFLEPDSDRRGTAYDYACEVLTLGLFIMDFKDAVREGDGDHILLLWKYMMLFFRATGRTNYATEAFTLLAQCNIILPPNLCEQVKWSRFVNVHGLPGHNISADLHMEHLNKVVKVAIEGLGANKSDNGIKRAAKAIGALSLVLDSYDSALNVKKPSGKHSDKNVLKDVAKITTQLLECDVFMKSTTKTHLSFLHMKRNLIKTLQEQPLKDWMVHKLTSLLQPNMPHLPIIHADSESSDNEC